MWYEAKGALVERDLTVFADRGDARHGEKAGSRVETVAWSYCHDGFVDLCKGGLEVKDLAKVVSSLLVMSVGLMVHNRPEVSSV